MLLNDMLKEACGNAQLAGRRVLVVEDEYVLAEDLLEGLLRCGVQVMGPVASVNEALDLLRTGLSPHLAILDIKLGNELVYPVADALRAQGVPFMFVTGCDGWNIPQAYADVPSAPKPFAVGA